MNTVMGCRPVFSRLITIRLRAAPFNITTEQVYAPMSDYDDNEIEKFSYQLQNVIDQTPRKGILAVQGDWNAKVGKDTCVNWQGICGPFCDNDTNERGLRLLEFGRDNITIGTWNTRTLRAAGRLQKVTHKMDRYRWNILGL